MSYSCMAFLVKSNSNFLGEHSHLEQYVKCTKDKAVLDGVIFLNFVSRGHVNVSVESKHDPLMLSF